MVQQSGYVWRAAVTRVFRSLVLNDVSVKGDRLRAAITFLLVAPLLPLSVSLRKPYMGSAWNNISVPPVSTFNGITAEPMMAVRSPDDCLTQCWRSFAVWARRCKKQKFRL